MRETWFVALFFSRVLIYFDHRVLGFQFLSRFQCEKCFSPRRKWINPSSKMIETTKKRSTVGVTLMIRVQQRIPRHPLNWWEKSKFSEITLQKNTEIMQRNPSHFLLGIWGMRWVHQAMKSPFPVAEIGPVTRTFSCHASTIQSVLEISGGSRITASSTAVEPFWSRTWQQSSSAHFHCSSWKLLSANFFSATNVTVIGRIAPMLKGVGISANAMTSFINTYFNVVAGWAIFYLVASFTHFPDLPWAKCGQ